MAINGADEDQEPPVVPLVEKVANPFTQISSVPLNVPAFGAEVTVTAPEKLEYVEPHEPVTIQ